MNTFMIKVRVYTSTTSWLLYFKSTKLMYKGTIITTSGTNPMGLFKIYKSNVREILQEQHPLRDGAAMGGGSGMSWGTGAGWGGGGGESGGGGGGCREPNRSFRDCCFCRMLLEITREPLVEGGEGCRLGGRKCEDVLHCIFHTNIQSKTFIHVIF